MMRKLKWLLPLAIFVPLLMAPSGGYPSHPTFQATGANFSVRAQGADTSSAGVISLLDGQSGNREWTLNSSVAGSGAFSIRDITAGSLDRFTISTTGDVSIPAPTSGIAFAVNGAATQFTALFTGSATAGQSTGVVVRSGTNSSDFAFSVQPQSAASNYFVVYGDGGAVVGAPTGGNKGSGSFNASTIYQNGNTLFAPQVVNLNAASTRTSTTSLTADAVLTLTLPAAGNYKLDFSGLISGMVTGQGGIDISFAIGSPGFSTSSYVCTISTGSTTAVANTGGTFTATPTSGNSCFFAAAAAYTGSAPLIMSGIVNASASTTVSVTWSQATSNATGTSIQAGAYLLATRLQ